LSKNDLDVKDIANAFYEAQLFLAWFKNVLDVEDYK
jgi:hypothetical protein